MSDGKERVPPFGAATQVVWDGFDNPSATPKDHSRAESASPRIQEKKPYRKPSYRFEQVFETMALACGKISPTQFQCRFHRHTS